MNGKGQPIVVTVVDNSRMYTLKVSPLPTKQIASLVNAPQLLCQQCGYLKREVLITSYILKQRIEVCMHKPFMLASVTDLLITHPNTNQTIFFTILKKGTTNSRENYTACTYIVHSSSPASVMSLILQRTVVIICRIITQLKIKIKHLF